MKLSRIFLGAFLICFPFQLQSLVYGGSAYITGNLNPFTTFFFNIGDILLVLALLGWGWELWFTKRDHVFRIGNQLIAMFFLLFVLVMLAGVLFAADRTFVLFMSFRFVLLFVFYLMIVNGVLTRKEVINLFLAGMGLQGLIALGQYVFQHSLGLSFLGESIIDPLVPGVAKLNWEGAKLIRSYGTFPHPNILSAGLLMALLLSYFRFLRKPWWLLCTLVLYSIPFLLTYSRAGFLALFAAFLLLASVHKGKFFLKYVFLFISVLLLFIVAFRLDAIFSYRFFVVDAGRSVIERQQYLEISKRMLIDHPFGVGVGNFTIYMQSYDSAKLMPWLYQPVHNVFMLIANELGFQGLFVFLVLLVVIFWRLVASMTFYRHKQNELLFGQVLLGLFAGIVTLMFFDHYFFSIYQGQVLLVLYLALASDFLKNPGLPLKKS